MLTQNSGSSPQTVAICQFLEDRAQGLCFSEPPVSARGPAWRSCLRRSADGERMEGSAFQVRRGRTGHAEKLRAAVLHLWPQNPDSASCTCHLVPSTPGGNPSNTTASTPTTQAGRPLGSQAAGADRGSHKHPRKCFLVLGVSLRVSLHTREGRCSTDSHNHILKLPVSNGNDHLDLKSGLKSWSLRTLEEQPEYRFVNQGHVWGPQFPRPNASMEYFWFSDMNMEKVLIQWSTTSETSSPQPVLKNVWPWTPCPLEGTPNFSNTLLKLPLLSGTGSSFFLSLWLPKSVLLSLSGITSHFWPLLLPAALLHSAPAPLASRLFRNIPEHSRTSTSQPFVLAVPSGLLHPGLLFP